MNEDQLVTLALFLIYFAGFCGVLTILSGLADYLENRYPWQDLW